MSSVLSIWDRRDGLLVTSGSLSAGETETETLRGGIPMELPYPVPRSKKWIYGSLMRKGEVSETHFFLSQISSMFLGLILEENGVKVVFVGLPDLLFVVFLHQNIFGG